MKMKLYSMLFLILFLGVAAVGEEKPPGVRSSSSGPVVGQAFIKNLAAPLNEKRLTWHKVSGPSWMAVSVDGIASGTPREADLGRNIFFIVTTDEEGNSNSLQYGLAVRSDERPAHQKVSVLFVGDNAESMREKRRIISDGLSDFLNTLAVGAVSFQIAFASTDYFQNGGELLQTKEGKRVIRSGEGYVLKDVRELWSKLDLVASTTSFWPQGLEVFYQAMNKNAAELMDRDSALAVVFISEREDASCQSHCFGVEPENNPGWVAHPIQRYSQLARQLSAMGRDVAVYPIIGGDDGSCVVPGAGHRYAAFQTAVGKGLVGSICDDKISGSLADVARAIVRSTN